MIDLKTHELRGYANIKLVRVSEVAERLSIPVSTMYYRLKHHMRPYEIRNFIRAVDEIATEIGTNFEVCKVENVPDFDGTVLERVQPSDPEEETRRCKNCVSFTGEHENGFCECFRNRYFDLSHTCENCDFYRRSKCVYNINRDGCECKEFDPNPRAFFNGISLEYGLDYATKCPN